MPRKGVVTHMIPYHQMTLADVFTETQELFESDKPEFLKLLESSIDLSELYWFLLETISMLLREGPVNTH